MFRWGTSQIFVLNWLPERRFLCRHWTGITQHHRWCYFFNKHLKRFLYESFRWCVSSQEMLVPKSSTAALISGIRGKLNNFLIAVDDSQMPYLSILNTCFLEELLHLIINSGSSQETVATSSFNTGLSTNLNLSTRISVSARVLARPQFQSVPQHVSQPLTAPWHTSASQPPVESITKPFETDPARIERRFLYVDNGGAPGRRRSVVSQRAPAAAAAGTAFFSPPGVIYPIKTHWAWVGRCKAMGRWWEWNILACCRPSPVVGSKAGGGGLARAAAAVKERWPPACHLADPRPSSLLWSRIHSGPPLTASERVDGTDIPRQMYRVSSAAAESAQPLSQSESAILSLSRQIKNAHFSVGGLVPFTKYSFPLTAMAVQLSSEPATLPRSRYRPSNYSYIMYFHGFLTAFQATSIPRFPV